MVKINPECARNAKLLFKLIFFMASRLKEKFDKEVVPALKKEFGYKNLIQVPKIEKIVVNAGVGKIAKDEKLVEWIEKGLTNIAGQKAVRTKAKKSIASFKSRQGMDIGIKVTLRGAKMYDFLDRLISTSLPRTRDFHGISKKNIDQNGNLTLGIKESIIFPEASHDKVGHIFCFQVTIVTGTREREKAEKLLRLLGFPISKDK